MISEKNIGDSVGIFLNSSNYIISKGFIVLNNSKSCVILKEKKMVCHYNNERYLYKHTRIVLLEKKIKNFQMIINNLNF